MIYSLKKYQTKANEGLKDLIRLAIKHLNEKLIESKTITFKAPTGSGKTFILSSLIEDLCNEFESEQMCFIWACPGKGELHMQSHDAVKTYLAGNPVCSLLDDEYIGGQSSIKNKEVVFVNWEKLVKKDKETGNWVNNLMKDSEGVNFLEVLDKTKIQNIKTILIVDESHIGTGINVRTRINEFIKTIIIPDITIEMSATPINSPDIEVNPQDVISEGMIKKDVIVNEGILKSDDTLAEKDSEQLVLEKGFNKRELLRLEFQSISANVNPLVLIQIPNTDAGDAKKNVVRNYLQEKGITETNGKLKLWCDDHAVFDKKSIKKNDDLTEFLIFKTAVATGWDCPRAHVLIKFREGQSETFETQTIGRILRTPEAKSYNNELLDNAYIFTNISSFESKQDTYNPNQIKTLFSKMKKGYTKLSVKSQMQLESFYRSRMGDYNSADSSFTEYFLNSFMKFFEFNESDKFPIGSSNELKLKAKGLNVDVKVSDTLMTETHIDVKVTDKEKTVSTDKAIVTMSENDVIAKYYSLIFENLNGLAYVRSKSPINSAIMDCLSTFYPIFSRSEKVKLYQRLIVNNLEIFSQILNESTYNFRKKLEMGTKVNAEYYDFFIDELRPYSEFTHTALVAPKSLYQPLYVLKDLTTGNPKNILEWGFLNKLDSYNIVEWYWENGTELLKINFGIPYNSEMNTFQPDFIVRFKNNSIGIFDTKAIDDRVEDTKLKAEALYRYISKMNLNRGHAPKVCGGIVIKTGSQFYLYNEAIYHSYNSNTDGWINFNDFIFEIEQDLKVMENALNYLNKK